MSNDHLYQLVHNMNQSEKRYFKLFIKRYSSKNDSSNFAKLFDFITKAKKITKEVLIQKCSFIKPSQVYLIKNRLYHYILMSLRAYNTKTTTNGRIELYQTMINYEILVTKGLYQQALNMLKKGEKITATFEYYPDLIEILDKKIHLLTIRLKSKNIKDQLREVHTKKQKIIQIGYFIQQFQEIYHQIYAIFKSEGRVLRNPNLVKKIKERLESFKDQLPEFDFSSKAIFLYYYCLALVYRLSGEWEKATNCFDIMDNYFTTDSKYIINNFNHYIRLRNGRVINSNMDGEFDLSLSNIQKIKDLANIYSDHKEVDLFIFETSFFLELEVYIMKFEFEKAVEFIEKYQTQIDSFDQELHSVNQQSKRYRIALSYFGAGNFEKALEWINKIIISDELKFRKDVLASVQLLNLLIHFELKNFLFLKNKIRSTTAYLQKIERWLKPEKLLVITIKKMITEKSDHTFLLKKLQADLISNYNKNPLDAYFLCYFDLIKWIDQKLTV